MELVMKKILCFIFFAIFGLLTSCQSTSSPHAVDVDNPIVPVNASANSDRSPKIESSSSCLRFGSARNFNDQRIVAFQKLVQLQILRIKSLPMTDESTQDLAIVESIRRRSSYPLLISSVRPKVVTKILSEESQKFLEFLEKRKVTDPQAQILFEEIRDQFLPFINNQVHWNCLEKPTDFQEG